MFRHPRSILAAAALAVSFASTANAQARPSRIVNEIDDTKLVRLPHGTHPLARAAFDRGRAPADLPFERMLLVLKPSAERESELEALLAAQQDPDSTQYHKWLTPAEFGARFGADGADIAKITGWLQSHGFSIGRVANAHNVIEFSGTAGQVEQTFHTEIHRYVLNGKQHWANASDPEVPAALTSVVAGVATLHNFRKAPQISNIKPQAVRIEAGATPSFTASDGTHALSPQDFDTIYSLTNIPGTFGAGVTIAVVARSNIDIQDIKDFQSAFFVPNNLPEIVVNGRDPGDLGNGDEAEAVLDTSWSGALAANATVKLVVSASTNTTDGVDLSELYIVDNNLADVMTESYGSCEASYTPAEAQFYLGLAQQAAAQGITYTVAAGDSGAEGCDDPASVTVARGPKSVNVLASTPYNIAVGGTQFNDRNGLYWGQPTSGTYATARSYIPEVAWNESCTAAQCGASAAGIWAGGGGASILFPKPWWQTGVLGMPNDGARDVPDISLTSAAHDFYLLCLKGSCTTKLGRSYFSGVSGTSAATPAFAAIMALVVDWTKSRQGQAAPQLYKLAATQSAGPCSATAPAVNCVFNDVVTGNNAVPGQVDYGSPAASYQAGVGYDLATGLGSVNAANLVLGWRGRSVLIPKIRLGVDSPSSLNATVIGLATFSGWALATSGSVKSVAISIDSVPFGQATYGARRSDVCALYSSADCPNVGWSFLIDTTVLGNGPHQVGVTVTSSSGARYTSSATFTVANWTAGNPININIDIPGAVTQTLSGAAGLGGWAISDLSAISQLTIAVDGVSYGAANYGGERDDVCNRNPGHIGCPNVGWNFLLDTTRLADGPHTLSVTAQSAGGQYSTAARDFIVANTPTNTILIAIDTPAAQSGAFSGATGFGGWAIGTTVPISTVSATIDGQPYGAVQYGGTRDDVCRAHPGVPGCPNVGWNFLVDTAQFVNGTHVLQIRAVTATGQFATATRIFTIANVASASSFAMNIDAPSAQNSILLGQMMFSGWALQLGGPLKAVQLAIDGAPQGASTYGLNRADVCAIYSSSNCPNVGWSFPVDTTQLANGSHTVTITALASNSPVVGTLSSSFTVANWTTSNPMKMSIDRPNAQMGPLSGLVGIGGWVIDQLAAISNVTIAVDNLSLGNAAYGGTRTDVCNVIRSAIGCPNIGWNYLLDTTLLGDGTHALAVSGTTTAGRSSTFTTTFQVGNSSSTPVHVSVDIPSANEAVTGVAHVGGWAVDAGGAQVLSVTVLVDGLVNGIASYGGPRADVCARYPSGGGCPNLGWDYQLDTTPFANGVHTLEIRALAADGQKYTASQPFVIANQP